MNVFRRKPRIAEPYRTWIEELAVEQRAAGRRWYGFEPKDSASGRRLMAAGTEAQPGFVLAAMKWIDYRSRKRLLLDYVTWAVCKTMQALLKSRLPLGHDDVVSLLEWSIRQPYTSLSGTFQTIKALQDYLKEHDLTPALHLDIPLRYPCASWPRRYRRDCGVRQRRCAIAKYSETW